MALKLRPKVAQDLCSEAAPPDVVQDASLKMHPMALKCLGSLVHALHELVHELGARVP